MKNFIKLMFISTLLIFSGLFNVSAEKDAETVVKTVFSWDGVKMPYANSENHGLQQWVDLVKKSVKDVNTTDTFSGSIQKMVLLFLKLEQQLQ